MEILVLGSKIENPRSTMDVPYHLVIFFLQFFLFSACAGRAALLCRVWLVNKSAIFKEAPEAFFRSPLEAAAGFQLEFGQWHGLGIPVDQVCSIEKNLGC